MIVVGGSVSSHEVIHEILPQAQHPVYASIRGEPIAAFGWTPFLHPHISVKKQISRLDPLTGKVFFEDGTGLNSVDHIIFGTGYSFSLPWLPHVQERINKAYRRLPGVYQHTWDIEDPKLAFVGMVSLYIDIFQRYCTLGLTPAQLGGGFTFRVYEWQAVAIARLLAGRGKALPPKEEQRKWEEDRVAKFKGGKDYYSIAPNYSEYLEFLRDTAGSPASGTTGRTLPPFDDKWLDVWQGMVKHKIQGFERDAQKAEEEEARQVKPKL